MRSKYEIPKKSDYMKAHSFNLIQTERTNCDLEHEKNVGRIDRAFYRNFSWQIMGKRKERRLSEHQSEMMSKQIDTVSRANSEVLAAQGPNNRITNGRLHDGRHTQKTAEEVVVESRTDFSGKGVKWYVSTCHFKPKVVPVWYTESLLIKIGSTKRHHDEKVWFKHRLQPYYWTETMTTEVNFPPAKTHISEANVAVPEMDGHYVSLEPQQIAASG